MNNKQHAFAVVPYPTVAPIPIPQAAWEAFCSDEQMTQKQVQWYRPKGAPRQNDVVWFTTDDKRGVTFGRAQLFRLPYDRTPARMLETEHGDPRIDMAEALFGRVREDDKSAEAAFASRLAFGDCVADVKPEEFEADWIHGAIVPRILSAPKPTSFQLYLTQDGTKPKDDLTTYFEGDTTTLRGHKLYWHRWDDALGVEQVTVGCPCASHGAHPQGALPAKDSQHTVMRPVKSGQTFRGQIRFENLHPSELGALLTVLDLPESAAHKIGMGKPLGLGSVRIKPTVRFDGPRKQRYAKWEQEAPHPSEDANRQKKCGDEFCALLNSHLTASREKGTAAIGAGRLDGVPRLDAMYAMLEWEARPVGLTANEPRPPGQAGARVAGTMGFPDFRARRVLPSPHMVAGKPEPPWPVSRPERAGAADDQRNARDNAPDEIQRAPAPVRSGTPTEEWAGASATYNSATRELTIKRKDQTAKKKFLSVDAFSGFVGKEARDKLIGGGPLVVNATISGRKHGNRFTGPLMIESVAIAP